MDLKHDWKALNEVLFQGEEFETNVSSVVLVDDGTQIIDGAVSNGKPFADAGMESLADNKEKLDALASKYGVDQAVLLAKEIIDQAIVEAAALGTNYFQQLQFLREALTGRNGRRRSLSVRGKEGLVVSRRHFVLDMVSRIRRVLPRRFNVLLFVDQRPSAYSTQPIGPFSYRAILLSYQDGQLDQFFEPDFTSLHENRLLEWQKDSDEIGQYLISRYMLPCYGIFMFKEEWERCLDAAAGRPFAGMLRKPWRLFVKYHDEGRAVVYPYNFLTKTLLVTQRLMVYFGRL